MHLRIDILGRGARVLPERGARFRQSRAGGAQRFLGANARLFDALSGLAGGRLQQFFGVRDDRLQVLPQILHVSALHGLLQGGT